MTPKQLDRAKRYRKKHPDRIKKRNAAYYRENRESLKAAQRARYWARKLDDAK